MPKIIAFSSPKGGCGATFVCAGVWLSLARKGISVLACDLCADESALDFALGFQDSSVLDISDVLGGFCEPGDAICIHSDFKNACFIRGSFDRNISDGAALERFLGEYDSEYILLDIPRSLIDVISSLCDRVVLVTDCTELSARMCAKAAECAHSACNIIINKIILQYIENDIFPTVDEIADSTGIAPIGLIPWSPVSAAYLQSGIDIIFTEKVLGNIFDNISSRLEGRHVPAADFDMYYDCFKIKRRR